jgi:hypothetical protein
MPKKLSAHDVLAFCILELGCRLPYEVAQEMNPSDPLYKALMEAWKEKEHRKDLRNALLCAVIANSFNSSKKKLKVEDFLPKTSKTGNSEDEIKANFIKYMEMKRLNDQ